VATGIIQHLFFGTEVPQVLCNGKLLKSTVVVVSSIVAFGNRIHT